MGEKNSPHDLLIKEESSLELSSSKISAVDVNNAHTQIQNASDIKVGNLNTLSDEEIICLERLKDSVVVEVSRGFTENVIRPGIYKENGKTYAVCPKLFFKEDEVIGAMIYDLCKISDMTVKVVDVPVNKSPIYNKKFIEGLWFGIFSSTALKRRRGKQDYELGRACSFALIVKNIFTNTDLLGANALVKDHFFFGNNPGEKGDKGGVVPYLIKTRLLAYFDKPELGNLILGILNHTAAAIGVSFLTAAEADRVIGDSIIPIDSLISDCYPTILIKKGKKQEKEKRKPNPIRSSPLYHKDEMNLLSRLTTPIFTELEPLQKDYENCVFTRGFAAVERQIHEVINLRWETLQRFANRTKVRLQDIRKISKDDKIRKANVTQTHVTALFKESKDMPGRLVSEIQHILGKYDVITAYTRAFNERPSSQKEAWLLITKRAIAIYNVIDSQIKVPTITEEVNGKALEKDYLQAMKLLAENQKINGELIRNLELVGKTKYFKLFGRTRQIENLIKGANKIFKDLQALPESAVDMSVDIYFEGLYRSRVELNKQYCYAVKEGFDKARKAIAVASYEEQDDRIQKSYIDFSEKADRLYEEYNRSVYNS